MKKALAIILSVMMLMSTLVACGSKTDDSGDANNDAAASYPTKNVNVIVPFSAGGNTDMSMRALLNVATSLDSGMWSNRKRLKAVVPQGLAGFAAMRISQKIDL